VLESCQTRSAQRAQTSPDVSIIDNPVNPDFGLRTPGSGTVIRIVTEIEFIGAALRAFVLCVLTMWQFFPDPDRDPETGTDSWIRIVMWIVTKM